MMFNLKINHVKTQMELDTDSAISVMTIDGHKEMFGNFPKMESSKVRLRTYTNELIQPLRRLPVTVDVNKQKKTLPLLILNNTRTRLVISSETELEQHQPHLKKPSVDSIISRHICPRHQGNKELRS
ncbi:hypothetical protein PoB_005227400 [Plakobranchus ocellatus]|uniref:Uncharacterized protein n=1 Tax=Plakobranchus ocellatus TaxID=259542 RepID=A0AAV4C4Z0_9GAST|nr:hypothetical protein PoB_005227400 [Plakobranchus ocellatus]